MKVKVFLSILLFGAMSVVPLQAKNVWTLNDKEYEVDTLVFKHQVGPGTTYAKYKLPLLPMQISVLEVDIKNKYIDFETCLGGDMGVKEEVPTSMYARNDRPGHDMVAATNGDFYFYQNPIENGIPRSGQFRRNECVTNPVGRAAFVLTDDRRMFVDRVNFSGKVTVGDVTTRLHTVNMQRLEWEDTHGDLLTLYTNSYGAETEKCVGGAKAIIRPKSGDFFWSANKNIVAVVEAVVDGAGVTEIPAGKALLYGKGVSETFVKTLAVGTEITLNLETNLSSQPGIITDFRELMGGSNHIILKDGVLIDEQAERHPRTCIGFSKDSSKLYLILVDGRWSLSAGATMGECAGIFLGLGAWNAVNLDGGGSSCMVVNKNVVNNLSDGVERPVGNGCLLISNAPVDEAIMQLGFGPMSYNIPMAAKIHPVIYGYNQYGVLKDTDLKGVTFTCDPAIGKITNDGYFIASTTGGTGKLTAHYNGIEKSVDVLITPVSANLRLSNVLLNSEIQYGIEIDGNNGNNKVLLDPDAFQWTSSDTQVCSITNGIIKGLSNGEATIVGEGLGFKGELKVVVEIPTSRVMAVDPLMDIKTWKVSQGGGRNMVATPLENGMKLVYTGAGDVSRNPNIKLTKRVQLWSLPDTIRLRINPGDAPITKVVFSLRPNEGSVVNHTIEPLDLIANEINIIDLPTASWIDAKDIQNYPIYLNSIQFGMGMSEEGKEYTVDIPGIETVYASIPLGVEGVEIDKKTNIYIYPNPVVAGDNAKVFVGDVDSADISIYSSVGQLLNQSTIVVNGGIAELPISNLSQGIYFVTINGYSAKVVIN